MKKTTRTARKVLSVFLSVLMMLTTWAVAVPGLVLAADGNKYYVKVYVNIYDGSDGYGGAYSVEESTGKPKNYSWATNDGWYGRINMTGFTVFGEAGDYDAQDVSAALLEAEKLNTYYNMSGLSDNNANGDWDSKAIAKAEYTFVLDSFPVEIFWMNDENNWDGGNTGFAIRKLTVATSEGGTEHTMWEGLAGSDSETYNYYGSITPTGIHTCFEDYAKNYDMNDYKFYKAITSSSQRAWTDPYTYGSAGTYYLNEYANGGVSATFSEGATSVASTVDYIDTSSTDTYYVNYTNHSKTQIAEITGTYNDGNFVSSPYGIKLNPGETRSFEINKSNYSKLAKYNNAANFTFEYTLSNVYASDELNAPLAKFTQPTYIGLWNEANDSPKYITDEDGDGSTGYTLYMSDNYGAGNNSMTMTNTFQVTEGIIERNSATTGSGSNSVTFNYNYYVDVSNVSTWEDTGLRIYVTENEYYRLPFQPKEHPSECGTITLSGNYANTGAASITIADIAFTNVTEKFWYSHSQASGYSTYGYYNQKGTPMWATQGKDAQATFYNNNPGWLRFAGTMIEPSDSSADPAKIVMDKMVYRENQNGQKAYFSGTINVYAFDKAELRDYIQKTLLDFAPMSLRYNTTAFENYQNKLTSAMNVLANQKTTQKAVANALAELKSAVEALQTTDNLINQVAELTHVQYVDDIASKVAASIPERYVLISLGEHTVPQNSAYIGNGEYKNATNKNADLKTNYSKADTKINILNYRYWNINYSDIDSKIADLETAINNFDGTTYNHSFKTNLQNAKDNLEAMKATVNVINTPTAQEDVDILIINADNLITHLGKNMRVHQWIEDDNGNYVAESDKDTHWYTCKICGYELVYNHYFEYEKIDDAQHKATCVTSGTDEGCGYSVTEDHIWVKGETVASTCTDKGYTNYSCACGATKKDDYQPLKEHADVNPSDHNCDVCGATLSECADGNNDHKCDVCGATLSECADNDKNHKCDVCGNKLSDCAWGAPVLTTKPTETTDGEYTYTCEICGGNKYVAVKRENYSAYDEAIKKAEELLENEDLTQAAKDSIEAAIEEAEKLDQQLPADVVVDGETIIDNNSDETINNATDALNNVLNGIVDGDGNINDESKKPDSTAAEEAVEAAEGLKETVENLPQEDEAAIDNLRTELDKILEEIKADENPTDAEYQDRLDAIEEAAKDILDKYADCSDGHAWVEIDLARPTKNDDGTWNNGTYTYECENCKATKTEPAVRAIYTEYDNAKAALEALKENAAITTEAKAEIEKILADNSIDDNLVAAEQSIVDAAAAALKAKLEKLTDENGNLKDEYKKPDSTAAEEAVEAAEGLKETVENLPQEDEAAIDNLRTELDKILEEIKADENPTDAEYQDRLDAIEEAAKDILEKYSACAAGNHTYEKEGSIVVTDPTCTENGYTTKTCDVCGKVTVIVDENSATDHDYNISEAKLIARPELVDGAWTDGKYEASCSNNNCDSKLVLDGVKRADYSAFEAAIAQIKEIAAYEDFTDEVKAAILAYAADLESGKYLDLDLVDDYTYENVTIKGEQDIIDAFVLELTKEGGVIDTLKNSKNDPGNLKPDYEAWEEAEGRYDALDKTNVKAEIITEANKLKEDIAKLQNTDGLTQATATQDDIDNATARLNEIIAGIKDGSLRDPDYSAVEDKINEAKGNDNLNKDTQDKIKEIEEALEAIKTKTEPEANAKDDQDDVNDLKDQLDEILDSITNGTATAPDYTEWDKAEDKYDALDKTNVPEGLVTEATNLKATIDALKAVDTANAKDDQQTIDAATARLNEIIAEINGILTEKPDFKDYDASHKAYEELVDQYGDKIKDSVADDVAALDTIVEGVRKDDTATKIEDQDTIDDAKTQLDAIIDGIKDGSLRDPDYSAVEDKINEAKGNDNLNKDTQDKIKEIEEALEAIKTKTEPEANAKDDQDDVNALEDQLDEILKDIADGKVTAPDYTEWDKAEDKYDAIDKTNVPEGLVTEATNLKATIDALKANDTANAKDDQQTIDNATKRLNEIIAEINGILTEKPDFKGYDASHKAYEELVDQYGDKIKDSVANDVADLDTIVEGVRTDETATKIEDQYKVDNAKTQLDAIIDGIVDGSLIKDANYDSVDQTLSDAKDKAEKNDVINGVKEEIKTIEGLINDLKNSGNKDQDIVDNYEDRLEEIIAGIDAGTLVKPDYTEADKDLADATTKAETNDVIDGVKDDIKDIKDALDAIKNDPTSTKADDQDDVDALEDALEDIIAGIKDGSLIKPDYTDAETAIGNAENIGSLTDDDKAIIEELKEKLDEIKNDPTSNNKEDQGAVNEIKDTVQNIINKYADCENGNHNWGAPVLTKDPTADAQGEYTETCGTCGATQITKVDRADYSKFDTVVGQLTGLLNTENLTDEAKTAINNALAKAEELDKNLPADVTTVNGKEIKGGQDKIDALVSELEKVAADTNTGIGNGKLIKPDYTNWDAAEGTYNDLDKKNVKVDILEEVAELKNTINGLKGDPTANKADDQITVNEAAARLNEIIAGIEDGSLRNPDYAEADKDLADATVKAETNDVIDGVKDDIKDIKDALEEIKTKAEPEANAKDDQDAVDALEDALEDIIAGIEDGSLVKPDYSDADKAIADAEKDIDNGGKLTEDDAKALEELKKQLDEIKNDPSSNKKDDQAAVDSIKSSVQEIVSRYSECAKGNHKYYVVGTFDPTCTEKGYTLYRCEVCGKTYKADFVDATGHTDANDDGTCDVCGATGLYDGCACLCHNNHWFWRIVYLIFRIIWKVFKIHPTCPCGRVHY